MLALAAALAAACFVRAFGIVYLGRPRSREAAEAHETARPQQVAMALLAGLCLLGGLFGSVAVSAIQPLLQMLAGAPLPATGTGPTPFSLVAFDAARSFTMRRDCGLLAHLSLLAAQQCTGSGRRSKLGPPWVADRSFAACQYSACFSQPLQRVAAHCFGASETIDMPQR
jgi:NADH:ubiquinone oxidoreductase subunit 5 (subunit L)/multisubunit Na+/H+ antiporter MnhA subunit